MALTILSGALAEGRRYAEPAEQTAPANISTTTYGIQSQLRRLGREFSGQEPQTASDTEIAAALKEADYVIEALSAANDKLLGVVPLPRIVRASSTRSMRRPRPCS